jgi:hypothetical protein
MHYEVRYEAYMHAMSCRFSAVRGQAKTSIVVAKCEILLSFQNVVSLVSSKSLTITVDGLDVEETRGSEIEIVPSVCSCCISVYRIDFAVMDV